jgi:hypothetical protein
VTPRQFDGDDVTIPDLRVGEIRALRTFRLSEYGYLNPVGYTAAGPWRDGPNTARCLGHSHTPAAPGCKCGFWAYGTYHAACDYAEARRLLAVVTCWGKVVPGTRGLRAQYARIEAIWLSGKVPRHFVQRLRRRYPSVTFYRSRRRMLRRNHPTPLDSYEPEPKPPRAVPYLLRQFRAGGARLGLTVAILMLCWGLMLLTLVAVALHVLWPGTFQA